MCENTVWCSEPYQLFDYDYDRTIKDKNRDVNSLRAQVQALQNVSADSAKARRAQLQAQLAEAEQDLNDTRYDHQIEMQQQGYDKLSQDMQEALDNAIKLINGNIDTLNQTAGAMLTQLQNNHIDEKSVIDGIVTGTGTKIHDETQAMLNETLTPQQILSDNAIGIANAVSAIATLLGQNPAEMANSLAGILTELGKDGTLSQAIAEFASKEGIKIDESGLGGVIDAIASPYNAQGQAATFFNEINTALGKSGDLYTEATNMKSAIGDVAKYLGTEEDSTFKRLGQIANSLGEHGTLSQALDQFITESGIQINSEDLEEIKNQILAPFDEKGKAATLFSTLTGAINGDTNSLFSAASGMKGAIDAMAGLLGKDADSVYTRMQQIIDDLGPTGTFSQAMKQYIDQENIKLDEHTSQMLDKLVAPYAEGGQAQYLMTQIKDSLTGETGVLKLLSDLGVTKTTDEEGKPDWKIDFSSINWKPVTKAISELNPKVNITLNSDNKDIKDKLDKIEEEVLSLKSPGGTNGETSKGNKPVADAGELEKLEEQKRQKQEDIQAHINVDLEELSKKDKDLEALQKKINELTTSHTMYNDKINAKKERLKEAKKNNEGTKKYEQIRQQISSLRTTRDAVAGEEAATVRAFNDLLAEINRDKERIAQMEEELKALSSFSSGSKRISKKQLAWTNENMNSLGAEMIVRKSDGAILTPLKANDAVIPANLADNLFKWGAISPDKFLSNPFLGKMGDIPQSATVNNQVDQQVQMHFDSLFTIQGNVDSDVMDRLEEFGKALTNNRNFQQNVVKFVTKDFVRESKKQGGFR